MVARRRCLKDTQEPVLLRALAAHHRLGGKADAAALAEFAANNDFSEKLRTEALRLLDLWENPPGRDRVTGLWRPIPKRPGRDVATAIRPALAGIMTGPDTVRRRGEAGRQVRNQGSRSCAARAGRR